MATTEFPKSFPFQPIRLSVARYLDCKTYQLGDVLELIVDGQPISKIPIADLLA